MKYLLVLMGLFFISLLMGLFFTFPSFSQDIKEPLDFSQYVPGDLPVGITDVSVRSYCMPREVFLTEVIQNPRFKYKLVSAGNMLPQIKEFPSIEETYSQKNGKFIRTYTLFPKDENRYPMTCIYAFGEGFVSIPLEN